MRRVYINRIYDKKKVSGEKYYEIYEDLSEGANFSFRKKIVTADVIIKDYVGEGSYNFKVDGNILAINTHIPRLIMNKHNEIPFGDEIVTSSVFTLFDAMYMLVERCASILNEDSKFKIYEMLISDGDMSVRYPDGSLLFSLTGDEYYMGETLHALVPVPNEDRNNVNVIKHKRYVEDFLYLNKFPIVGYTKEQNSAIITPLLLETVLESEILHSILKKYDDKFKEGYESSFDIEGLMEKDWDRCLGLRECDLEVYDLDDLEKNLFILKLRLMKLKVSMYAHGWKIPVDLLCSRGFKASLREVCEDD